MYIIIYCYILIIPGFGIISHVIGTMSDKSVFGQCGPKNIFSIYFSKRTICRKILKAINYLLLLLKIQNTKIISNSNYFFLVKMFVLINNPQITNSRVEFLPKFKIRYFFEFSMIVGISEAIRSLLTIYYNLISKSIFNLILNLKIEFLFSDYLINNVWYKNVNQFSIMNSVIDLTEIRKGNYKTPIDPFSEWLAGIIDGDGCFLVSKKGYASLEITIQLRDVRCLNIIKHKYGGSVKVRANQNHLRYRLHHKKGLLLLISEINGLIRNPIRMLQLAKICEKYDIPFYYPEKLIYNNGWLSGFFDADGSVYLNLKSAQVFITAGQKNKLLLDPLKELYGGNIYLSKGPDHFKWVMFRKNEIIKLLNYFKLYKPKSGKLARINLIPKYYELRDLGAHKASANTILGKAWKQFLVKWDSFDYR